MGWVVIPRPARPSCWRYLPSERVRPLGFSASRVGPVRTWRTLLLSASAREVEAPGFDHTFEALQHFLAGTSV